MNGMHTYNLMIRPALCLAIALTFAGHACAVDGQSAFPVASTPKPLTPLMQRELRGCFNFFWKQWNSDPASPTYGMTAGDYVGMPVYSPIPVESQGFYFAAIVIGVERGWITREEGKKRILITLSYLGIDKGLVLLMFENHSTQLIWRLLHQNTHIQRGLKRLEFMHVK